MEGSYKYRVKYKKYGVMKFLGHLDVLRFFQKAIKRSGLPIAYSEGFNPHQLLSFAAPLSVGVESEGEYFDMELLDQVSTDEIVSSLGGAMVDGVEITEARYLEGKVPNAMASVSAARYRIRFDDGKDEEFYDFIDNSRHILIVKKTKKSEKEIDLKPLVYEYKKSDDEVEVVLPCGSKQNIKPQLLLDAFDSEVHYSLYRVELYYGDYPDLKSLLEV